ncbi:MAG: hypothetical protein RBR47_07425 [Bacteroidales bacterium]|jgi:hypothetical protein|nr:hypothetical protein [Bacteroidales bacterium]NCU35751.1 hypothetical protein [Candidatus Falkowbacteria bacterium]MDD2633167.1 hypothetical protein [Bacteroidales bacterium]MDD3130329.1 hypothetical protein [Bacteroidales bacterium]MDD3526645.1 hypothetical protein [Bacteroidales bacterium]
MKSFLLISLAFVLAWAAAAQEWSTPVNVSNMEGQDRSPDFCIDGEGSIHCVWVHDYELNFAKIFYSRSIDGGFTWTTPKDISNNNEKMLGTPKIIPDSNNIIFVTYDFNTGNPSGTIILMKTFDGISWSAADTITPEMPGSRHSKLVIDQNNRLYCFWYHDMNNGTTFYKYFENNVWSETMAAYPGNHYLTIMKLVCDATNKMHCIAKYHAVGENHNKDRLVYFNMLDNTWSSLEEISKPTEGPGEDIDIDSYSVPHVAFMQESPITPPNNDSTVYIHLVGTNWTEPELVVEDPRHQRILIDEYDKPNIFDIEKTEDGCMLVHHYKLNNQWEGCVVGTSPWNTTHYSVLNRKKTLFLIYNKPTTNNEADLFFTKTDIVSSINKEKQISTFDKLQLFPNPFTDFISIQFNLDMPGFVTVKIYSLKGELINTLLSQKLVSGKCRVVWDGKDKNGNETASSVYLVRIIADKNIITRSIEKIN